jgi:hypothetical protein
MAISQIAQRFADEIRMQDWSDSHTRLDGARHDRTFDRTSSEQLSPEQAERVRINVMWVVAQTLSDDDPNFDAHTFAAACGVSKNFLFTRSGKPNGGIWAGIRPSTRKDH